MSAGRLAYSPYGWLASLAPRGKYLPCGNNVAAYADIYWNNMVHDIMLAHGFTEAAGNYQYKNATGLGLGGDPIRVEAQDGSGRDNANFYPTPDGQSGTMQMYLFDNANANQLVINSSGAGAGTYKFVSWPTARALPSSLLRASWSW